MLEFKEVLESLGFNVKAQRLTIEEFASIRVPAVLLLMLPPGNYPANRAEPFLGHYLLLWPLEEGAVQIQNYPREPVVLPIDYLIRHLRHIGVENIPVLLCGKQRQSLEEMLSPLATENNRKEVKRQRKKGKRAAKHGVFGE